MTELKLWVEKCINFEKAFKVADDLDLSDLGVVKEVMVDLTPNLAQTESSIGKKHATEKRDTQKRPKYDGLPIKQQEMSFSPKRTRCNQRRDSKVSPSQ